MKKRFFLLGASIAAWLLAGNVEYGYAAEDLAVAYSEDIVYEDIESAARYINQEFIKQTENIVLKLDDELFATKGVSDVVSEILEAAPAYYETNYVNLSMSQMKDYSIIYIRPNYIFTAEENEELLNAIDKVLEELELEDKNDYQKVRAIHDYICDNVNYDFTFTKYDSYDAMITGEAVCQGYANLFYRMCYEVGLDVKLISGIGAGGNHAWNIVKIGDVYYNIDTTWDGQDDETYYTYFLKNEVDFYDHYRDGRYSTEEYYSKYPMAEDSWMDWSSLKDNMNIQNIGTVNFNTIDGGKVTNQAQNGRGKLLLFGAAGCGLTQQTLINIASSDFSDVDVVFIEGNGASKDTVEQIKELFGGSSKDIIYAYDNTYSATFALYEYAQKLGVTVSTYPLLVYIDDENMVRDADVSTVSSADHIRAIVNTWVINQEIAQLSETNITMDKDTTSQLSMSVLGLKRNGQFFSWTSSNEAIVSVDVNGKITALKAGTATITCKVNDELEYLCTVTVSEVIIPDGLNKGKDGVWYYYKDNAIDTSFTGLAKNSNGWWYVKNGKLDRTYTGLGKNVYGWWYVKAGKVDLTFTGMAKNENGWFYVKNGKVDLNYTGLAENQYGTWYMVDGKVASNISGLTKVSKVWMYLSKGKVDTSYVGLAKNDSGWWYVANGQVDFSYTGMAKNQYGWWYVTNGKLDRTYTGMAKNQYGWWYITKGQLDRNFTGIASNEYGSWYIENGAVEKTYTGTVQYKGVTYNIKNGKVV